MFLLFGISFIFSSKREGQQDEFKRKIINLPHSSRYVTFLYSVIGDTHFAFHSGNYGTRRYFFLISDKIPGIVLQFLPTSISA